MIIYTSCWSTMLYWFHEKLTCLTYGCFCTLPYFWQMKKNMWKRIFFLNGWVLVKNFFSFLNDLSPLLFFCQVIISIYHTWSEFDNASFTKRFSGIICQKHAFSGPCFILQHNSFILYVMFNFAHTLCTFH